MMEQQKLDLNQPVLSVRRFGTAAATPEVESKARTESSHDNFPAIPFYKADLKSGPIRHAGTVPFVWERTPGRPKVERRSVDRKNELPPIAPRLPPGRRRDENEKQQPVRGSDCIHTCVTQTQSPYSSSKGSVTLDDRVDKSSEEDHLDTEGFSSDDDDAYVDARDTLSKTESYYDNCTLSEFSGMEGSDASLAGSVSTDPRTRDFMMGRFLPAAKAMASEIPPHASKNMYMARQRQKQATVVVKAARRIPSSDYKPNLLRFYIQNDIEEDSEEDTDDESDQRNISSKGCGLLPRLCLLSPVPGLRVSPRSKATSVRRVPPNSSGAAHGTKSATEATFAAPKRATAIHENRSSPIVESLSVSGNSAEAKKAKNFASGPKSFKTFQDFLMDQNAEDESQPESPVVEKTLYVDSVHSTKTASSLAINSNTMGLSEKHDQFPEKNEITTDTPCGDFSLQEVKYLNLTDESKNLQAEDGGHFESYQVARRDDKLLTGKYFREDVSVINSIATSAEVKIVQDSSPQNKQLQLIESSHVFQLPQPPPLPNSPSDSWLGRTLPRKNHLSRSHQGSTMQIHSKQQTPNQASADPKWESIVKTSKHQYGHLRYSEEMLTPIPEV